MKSFSFDDIRSDDLLVLFEEVSIDLFFASSLILIFCSIGTTLLPSIRSMGVLYCNFKKSKIDLSSGNSCNTSSPFIIFLLDKTIRDNPCSFNE